MIRVSTVILLLGLLLLSANPAAAEEPSKGLALSLGLYDFFDDDFRTMEAGVEYRFRPFTLWKLDLKPAVGFSATKDKSFWAYAGLRYDLPLSTIWRFTPQFSISLYDRGEEGKLLGGLVEFRTGFELSRRLKNGTRLGVLVYHLSHSHIYGFNPGSESLLLTWSQGR